jgi:hypothetical protein
MEEKMKTLKRMIVALLALLPLATGVAVADDEHGYSRIFIFGASFIPSSCLAPVTVSAGIISAMVAPGSNSWRRRCN